LVYRWIKIFHRTFNQWFSELTTEDKAKALGIQEFVPKPLVTKELAGMIQEPWTGRKKAGLSLAWTSFP